MQKEQEEADNKAKLRSIANWRRKMLQGWEAMGKYIQSQSNTSPDITDDKEKLSTRREVCVTIEKHVKNVVENKYNEIGRKGITRERQVEIITKAF